MTQRDVAWPNGPESKRHSAARGATCRGGMSRCRNRGRDTPRAEWHSVRPPVHGQRTVPAKDERLSVDDLKRISADFAAIYEHCEQASSERL